MNNSTTELWAAVDWSDKSHTIVVVDGKGKEVTSFMVPHSAEGLSEMVGALRQCGSVLGVAVEISRHMVVQKLSEANFVVYPINPKLSHAWRQGWKAAAPKSELTDARVLADGLRQHHERLSALRPDEPRTRELGMLCGDEIKLIAERTALVNRLKATLKEYYPAALHWFSDWTSPTAWDFVLTFPRPEHLMRASRNKLIGFLKSHYIGLSPLWQERVEGRKSALEWPSDSATVEAKSLLAVSTAKQLRTLEAALDVYRERIENLYQEHPDSSIFSSLPRAADKLAPRLLTAFGTQRDRYESANSLQELSGTVPVPHQSGQQHRARFRRACRKDFRSTMFLFALQTIEESVWARLFYDKARQAGQSHSLALRNLAAKWLKIIYRMWQTRTRYDEGVHLASLLRRGSPIVRELAMSKSGG